MTSKQTTWSACLYTSGDRSWLGFKMFGWPVSKAEISKHIDAWPIPRLISIVAHIAENLKSLKSLIFVSNMSCPKVVTDTCLVTATIFPLIAAGSHYPPLLCEFSRLCCQEDAGSSCVAFLHCVTYWQHRGLLLLLLDQVCPVLHQLWQLALTFWKMSTRVLFDLEASSLLPCSTKLPSSP